MIGYIALGIGLLVSVRILLMIDDWKRDLTQNHARWTENAEQEDMRPLIVSGTVDQTAELIIAWVEGESRWSLESRAEPTGDGVVELYLVRTTALLRFKDDIRVAITPLANGSGVAQVRVNAESKSRIGKGDLGQNPRNLNELRQSISE